MNTRMMTAAAMAALALGHGAGGGLREPSPEKYSGQRKVFRKGAWKGDGVVPSETRQARRRKALAETRALRG